jgi:hypothetical protein
MHLRMAARALQTASTETLLGWDHPLVRLLERIAVRVEGSAVVMAILSVGVAGLVVGVADALDVVIAAGVTEVLLIGSAAILVSDLRACVRDLIIDGRGGIPLAVVQRERRRLTARENRAELQRSLTGLACEAVCQVAAPRYPRPLYTPGVVAAVAGELRATARMLDRDGVGAHGVALTERLLNGHDSPLYGRDASRLRDELRRIEFALLACDGSSEVPPPDALRSAGHC